MRKTHSKYFHIIHIIHYTWIDQESNFEPYMYDLQDHNFQKKINNFNIMLIT